MDAGLYLDAHRITSPWNEDVTWSTRPGFDPNVESSAYITGNGWYSWDLTSLVQQWINGTMDNYGVAIYDHGSSYYQRFVSSDNMEATEPSWALPP
ncbi:MAG: DNRLRE domain-containing protein, partial [Candidatus Bathyarchaeia archaeon]